MAFSACVWPVFVEGSGADRPCCVVPARWVCLRAVCVPSVNDVTMGSVFGRVSEEQPKFAVLAEREGYEVCRIVAAGGPIMS